MKKKPSAKARGANNPAARIGMISMASLLTSQIAMAQFEDFPPPPPPPPAFGNENAGEPMNLNSSVNSGAADEGAGVRGEGASPGTSGKKDVMTKNTKNKFNQAGAEDITNENFPETIESFDFPNVEITDIIRAISELTGKNFIIDPGVRGKITIIAPSKLTVAEAYKAFLSALAINGFTVVPSGSFLKVKSARNAQRDSIETYSGSYYPNSDQMITRIIHLKHISAEQVNRDLRILPSKDGEMSVYPPTNSIILSDYGSNIDRVMKIISQLDVPGFEEQMEVIQIKYAKVKDLADLIDKIVNKGEKSGGSSRIGQTFTAGVPRFSRAGGTSAQQGASSYVAIPDDRTNSIIVIGNKSGIQRIKKLIAQLDFRINPQDNGGVNVYYVKYGEAEKIAQTLTGVTKDASPKTGAGASGSLLSPMGPGGMIQPPQEIFGGDVKITADKNTNSLVIVASKQDYETVLNLLSKIDIARDQVYVETIIMEMSDNDVNNWGVTYFNFASGGIGKTGFNGGNTNFSDLFNPASGNGAILSFGAGQTVNVTDPTTSKSIAVPSLLGLINFIKTVKKTNILSTPAITAMDNQEAEIEVGDKIATGSTVTQGTNGQGNTVTPIFEDATIKLNIKPFISPSSESIRMEIKQNVKQLSSALAPKALQDSTQALATRSIKTTVVVRNGDTAVIGGLIKDQQTESVTKVPLLGDIPIIGWLFKSKGTQMEKVNMVVFITPTIIRSPTDGHNVLAKRLDKRLDFIKNSGGKDPYGKVIDEVVKSASSVRDDNPVPNSPLNTPTTQE